MVGELEVFDPRGPLEVERRGLAPRPASLAGLRLAILDNTKWNAGRLLRTIAAELGARFPLAAVGYYKKESFSKEAEPELLGRIAAGNDIVLTAIGD